MAILCLLHPYPSSQSPPRRRHTSSPGPVARMRAPCWVCMCMRLLRVFRPTVLRASVAARGGVSWIFGGGVGCLTPSPHSCGSDSSEPAEPMTASTFFHWRCLPHFTTCTHSQPSFGFPWAIQRSHSIAVRRAAELAFSHSRRLAAIIQRRRHWYRTCIGSSSASAHHHPLQQSYHRDIH